MNIWYCDECGDYSFLQPNTPMDKYTKLQDCLICHTQLGIVPLHEKSSLFQPEKDVSLESFALSMKKSMPNTTFDSIKPQNRPLNYFLRCLNRTKYFINIATESIDGFFLGMLATKVFDSDIEVHVIVWHPQKIYQDLRRLMDHAVFIRGYEKGVRPLMRGITIDTISEAHQKLIIIDGQIAFLGSANATLDGWTRSGEIIQFETDIDKIQNLNHTYFSTFTAKKRNK